MAAISKKVIDRYRNTVPKFQRVLKGARDRDVNESDTVLICQDILSEVMGFDKYEEITSEYAIRGTYCDLAIKIDEKIQYLIEVKAIGLTLKDDHLKQAINYGANRGIQWVVLTNGIRWELYKILFERPVDYELVAALDFLELNAKKESDQEKLFLLSKRGVSKKAREDYYERVQSVNRFIISAVVTSEPILYAIRRTIRKLAEGLKIETKELEKILLEEVLKRDTMEGDEAAKAAKRVRKLIKKSSGKKRATPVKRIDPIEGEKDNGGEVR